MTNCAASWTVAASFLVLVACAVVALVLAVRSELLLWRGSEPLPKEEAWWRKVVRMHHIRGGS